MNPSRAMPFFVFQIKDEFIGKGLLLTDNESRVSRRAHDVLIEICPDVIGVQDDIFRFYYGVTVNLHEVVHHRRIVTARDDRSLLGQIISEVQPGCGGFSARRLPRGFSASSVAGSSSAEEGGGFARVVWNGSLNLGEDRINRKGVGKQMRTKNANFRQTRRLWRVTGGRRLE